MQLCVTSRGFCVAALCGFFICTRNLSLAFQGDTVTETKCRIYNSQINKEYTSNTSRGESLVYSFYVNKSYIQDAHNTNLRVEVEAERRTTLRHPILFAVGQRKFITTFEIPYTFDSSENDNRTNAPIYFTAGRNLCLPPGETEAQNITIRVSTTSKRPVYFRLKVSVSRDFQIPIGREISLDVSPTSPKYLGFQFSRPDVSLVKVKASSGSNSCLTLSVQSPQCPIYDRENNVRFQGLWQTMTTKAAMTLERTNRFEEGFIVVLVAHDTNEKCSKGAGSSYIDPFPGFELQEMRQIEDQLSSNSSSSSSSFARQLTRGSPLTKNVKLIITNESGVSSWIYFLCLFIPVFSTFFLIIVVTCLFRNRHTWLRVEAEQKLTAINCGLLNSVKTDARMVESYRHQEHPSPVDELVLHDLGVLPSPEEDDEIAVGSNGIPLDHFISKRSRFSGNVRWRADLMIADFVQRDPMLVAKSSRRFYWTIIIIAIFYCIPVYQLILHYLRVLYRTGEYDICYYNFLCAQRLGLFVDFNHFWSNVSYIIFGFAFVFFVNRRANNMVYIPSKTKRLGSDESEESLLKKCCGYAKIPCRWDHGIPQNWGMFYALGIALALEGVLSAAYHLCPNQSSFQFDTCFMYVISVLILLKIYQLRHPVHLGANHTFAILACFVLISVVGLMFEFLGTKAKTIYRWSFIGIQFLSMFLLSLYFYCVGYIKDENGGLITTLHMFGYVRQLKETAFKGDRIILPGISFLLGFAVLIYCELNKEDFATYLLYVLVANVIGFTVYYVGIMKPLHGEFKNRTWVQPTLYFLGAGVFGGFAVRQFVASPAAWEVSAADSRAGNEECMTGWFPFHPFYDSHDVWHFLSAAALFLSFMALLIVDDDLLTVPHDQIPVF